MSKWIPVSPEKPCQICHRPSWCLISPDGKAHLCNRVQSDHPAKGGGWIHGAPILKNNTSNCLNALGSNGMPKTCNDKPDFDSALWWATARHVTRLEKLQPWADQLGLPVECIDWLGGATISDMLTFPMHSGTGNICGIRTRNPDGSKKAITGSKAGVFLTTIPLNCLDVLICEGPTDAVAAMALDFEPIGRPSCIGQEQHVIDTLKRWGKYRVTICADADGPGIAGAERLAQFIRACRIAVRLVAPVGHKDLSDWYKAGATRADVDLAWGQAAYNN